MMNGWMVSERNLTAVGLTVIIICKNEEMFDDELSHSCEKVKILNLLECVPNLHYSSPLEVFTV